MSRYVITQDKQYYRTYLNNMAEMGILQINNTKNVNLH